MSGNVYRYTSSGSLRNFPLCEDQPRVVSWVVALILFTGKYYHRNTIISFFGCCNCSCFLDVHGRRNRQYGGSRSRAASTLLQAHQVYRKGQVLTGKWTVLVHRHGVRCNIEDFDHTIRIVDRTVNSIVFPDREALVGEWTGAIDDMDKITPVRTICLV